MITSSPNKCFSINNTIIKKNSGNKKRNYHLLVLLFLFVVCVCIVVVTVSWHFCILESDLSLPSRSFDNKNHNNNKNHDHPSPVETNKQEELQLTRITLFLKEEEEEEEPDYFSDITFAKDKHVLDDFLETSSSSSSSSSPNSKIIQLRNERRKISSDEVFQMNSSLQQIEDHEPQLDDDLSDIIYDLTHPAPKEEVEDSGPLCRAFRSIPNCTCTSDLADEGSCDAEDRGASRCFAGKCREKMFRPYPKTLKMSKDSALFHSRRIINPNAKNHEIPRTCNFYFAPSLEQRMFIAKLRFI